MVLRLFKNFVIFVIVVVLGLIAALYFIAPNFLKREIETTGTKSIKALTQVQQVQLTNLYPIEFTFTNLSIASPNLNVSLPKATISLSLQSMQKLKPKISFKTFGLKASYLEDKTAMDKPSKSKRSNRAFSVNEILPVFISDITFDADLKNSKIKYDLYEVDNINVSTNLNSINEPLILDLGAQLRLAEASIPVTLSLAMELKDESLVLKKGELSLLSVKTNIQGYIQPSSMAMDLTLKTKVANLKDVPLPKAQLISSWQGELQLDGRIYRKDKSQSPYFGGTFSAKDIDLGLESKGLDYNVLGRIKISSSGEVKYLEKLTLKDLTWNFDASNAKVEYKKFFSKPANVLLTSKGKLNFRDKIEFEKSNVTLEKMFLLSEGVYDPTGVSDIRFEIPRTSLVGLEKYFPPIKSYPLQGYIETKGRLAGVLSNPEKIIINIQSFAGKGIKGNVDYENEGLVLRGPANIDVQSQLDLSGTELTSGSASAILDFSGMEIRYKDIFKKKSAQQFRLEIEGAKSGSEFKIKKGFLQSFFGRLDLSGKPPLHLNDRLNLHISLPDISLTNLRESLPGYKKIILPGSIKGQVDLNGQLNSADFMQSKIVSRADIEANLSEFSLQSSDKNKTEPSDKSLESSLVEPIISDTQVFRSLGVKLKAKLGKFNMPQLEAKNISFSAQLEKGNLHFANATVGSVFGGSAIIKKAKLPLMIENPVAVAEISYFGIDVSSALSFLDPKWQELAKGKVSGELGLQTILPGSTKFLEELNAQGSFQLKDGVLSTLNFETMAKEALSKIPGAGAVNLSRGPLQVSASGDFTFDDSILHLNTFKAVTARREEASLSGKLKLNMDVDMSGQVVLVDMPSGGDFWEANKDASGRIIVPVSIKGNALSPNMSFASETIKTMTGKLAEYELKKATKSVEDKVKDEVGKKLKGLFK